MSEYREYELSILSGDDALDIIHHFRSSSDAISKAINPDGTSAESTTAGLENELIKFSLWCPSAIFMLDTGGEDSGSSRTYVQCGKSYTVGPEIIWPAFDPNQLE